MSLLIILENFSSTGLKFITENFKDSVIRIKQIKI